VFYQLGLWINWFSEVTVSRLLLVASYKERSTSNVYFVDLNFRNVFYVTCAMPVECCTCLVTMAFLFQAHSRVEEPLVVDGNASTGTQRTIFTGKKFLVNPEQVSVFVLLNYTSLYMIDTI
jgi:hypothetical protein